MRFDLHTHSSASDGVLTPSELMLRAVEHHVEVVALTDHDTLAGIACARQTINEKQLPLRLITGIEISTAWEHHEIHIVALGVNDDHGPLTEFLGQQRERRERRAEEMGRRLEKCLLPGIYEEAKALAGAATVTRAHFARVLVARGVAEDTHKVFKKYLSRGNKGYVPPQWLEMAAAIEIIHDAAGVAILAHPGRYNLTAKWRKRLLVAFKEAGGDGIEVSCSQQSPQERAELGTWANEHDLYISVGSDFHYPTQWAELGQGLWLPKDGTPIWLAYPELFRLTALEHATLQANR